MTKKDTKKKRLILLDAHAIIHRAYHALPNFSNSAGEPTGALYGIAAMVMKIIDELKPDFVVACFDLPEPTHRHEVYKEYKAGRKKADPELVSQIIRSREIFDVFDIPIYEKVGFEADDVLGVIADQTKNDKDLEIIIASGDMDTLQLIDGERVKVYTLRKGLNDTILYNEKAVIERFGFGPEKIADYKGLRGDPSDNIPGVKGIGEKTATNLILEYGSVEGIFEEIKKVKEKEGEDEYLKVFKEKGFTPRIIGLLEDGEEEAVFSKMLATIRLDVPITFKIPEDNWMQNLDAEKITQLFENLEFRSLITRAQKTFNLQDVSNTEVELKKEDVDEGELQKTAIALWLIKSDITNPEIEDILHFANTKSFTEANESIFKVLKERGLEKVFSNIEQPLIPVIKKLEDNGVLLDKKYFTKLSKTYHIELEKHRAKIYKYAGVEFNINSPKQLGEILFDTLELKPKNQKKTAGGQRSTRESELEKMADMHPVIAEILAYRELQKLLSTYIDTLPDMVGKDGRLRAKFLQTGTTTGRLASQAPNLQNIPTKTDLGKAIRGGFVAGSGNTLLALDYSQIELRIAAILSNDAKLISVFKNSGDIHSAVAQEVFGVEKNDVTADMRRQAKVINFGILYGMGVNALKVNLGGEATQKDAREFLNRYFESFSGLAGWIDAIKSDAARLGYTETLFGRRRYFVGFDSQMPHIRAAAERMAVNAPIQGTQADVIKIAMVNVDEYLQKSKLDKKVKMILQVHDEMIFEVEDEIVEKVADDIKKIMEQVLTKEQANDVPILADIKSGKSWGEMK